MQYCHDSNSPVISGDGWWDQDRKCKTKTTSLKSKKLLVLRQDQDSEVTVCLES